MSRKKPPRPELAAKRREAGHTQQSFAEAINSTKNTVRCWEQGWSAPHPRYRAAIAAVLGVSLAEVDRLIERRPVDVIPHDVPTWLSHYESLVQAAGRLSKIESLGVPGLLQTKAYGMALERLGPALLTDDQVIDRIDKRINRQAVLYRDPLFESVNLIAEHVLQGVVGSREIMVEQCDHLLELTKLPNVHVQLLPSDGRDVCARGGFELLTKIGESKPFMTVVGGVGTPTYHEDPLLMKRYLAIYEYVARAALPSDESTCRIRSMRETHFREGHHP